MKTPLLFFILVLIQAAHSLEEYLTHLYHWLPVTTSAIHDSIDLIPIMSMRGGTFAVLNLIFLVFLSIICILVFRRNRWAWKVVRIVAVIEIINGMVHLSAAAYTGGYFPGTVSAGGLFITGLLVLRSGRAMPPVKQVSI